MMLHGRYNLWLLRLVLELACFGCLILSDSPLGALVLAWLTSACTLMLCLKGQHVKGATAIKGAWAWLDALLLPLLAVVVAAGLLRGFSRDMLLSVLRRKDSWIVRPALLYYLVRAQQSLTLRQDILQVAVGLGALLTACALADGKCPACLRPLMSGPPCRLLGIALCLPPSAELIGTLVLACVRVLLLQPWLHQRVWPGFAQGVSLPFQRASTPAWVTSSLRRMRRPQGSSGSSSGGGVAADHGSAQSALPLPQHAASSSSSRNTPGPSSPIKPQPVAQDQPLMFTWPTHAVPQSPPAASPTPAATSATQREAAASLRAGTPQPSGPIRIDMARILQAAQRGAEAGRSRRSCLYGHSHPVPRTPVMVTVQVAVLHLPDVPAAMSHVQAAVGEGLSSYATTAGTDTHTLFPSLCPLAILSSEVTRVSAVRPVPPNAAASDTAAGGSSAPGLLTSTTACRCTTPVKYKCGCGGRAKGGPTTTATGRPSTGHAAVAGVSPSPAAAAAAAVQASPPLLPPFALVAALGTACLHAMPRAGRPMAGESSASVTAPAPPTHDAHQLALHLLSSLTARGAPGSLAPLFVVLSIQVQLGGVSARSRVAAALVPSATPSVAAAVGGDTNSTGTAVWGRASSSVPIRARPSGVSTPSQRLHTAVQEAAPAHESEQAACAPSSPFLTHQASAPVDGPDSLSMLDLTEMAAGDEDGCRLIHSASSGRAELGVTIAGPLSAHESTHTIPQRAMPLPVHAGAVAPPPPPQPPAPPLPPLPPQPPPPPPPLPAASQHQQGPSHEPAAQEAADSSAPAESSDPSIRLASGMDNNTHQRMPGSDDPAAGGMFQPQQAQGAGTGAAAHSSPVTPMPAALFYLLPVAVPLPDAAAGPAMESVLSQEAPGPEDVSEITPGQNDDDPVLHVLAAPGALQHLMSFGGAAAAVAAASDADETGGDEGGGGEGLEYQPDGATQHRRTARTTSANTAQGSAGDTVLEVLVIVSHPACVITEGVFSVPDVAAGRVRLRLPLRALAARHHLEPGMLTCTLIARPVLDLAMLHVTPVTPSLPSGLHLGTRVSSGSSMGAGAAVTRSFPGYESRSSPAIAPGSNGFPSAGANAHASVGAGNGASSAQPSPAALVNLRAQTPGGTDRPELSAFLYQAEQGSQEAWALQTPASRWSSDSSHGLSMHDSSTTTRYELAHVSARTGTTAQPLRARTPVVGGRPEVGDSAAPLPCLPTPSYEDAPAMPPPMLLASLPCLLLTPMAAAEMNSLFQSMCTLDDAPAATEVVEEPLHAISFEHMVVHPAGETGAPQAACPAAGVSAAKAPGTVHPAAPASVFQAAVRTTGMGEQLHPLAPVGAVSAVTAGAPATIGTEAAVQMAGVAGAGYAHTVAVALAPEHQRSRQHLTFEAADVSAHAGRANRPRSGSSGSSGPLLGSRGASSSGASGFGSSMAEVMAVGAAGMDEDSGAITYVPYQGIEWAHAQPQGHVFDQGLMEEQKRGSLEASCAGHSILPAWLMAARGSGVHDSALTYQSRTGNHTGCGTGSEHADVTSHEAVLSLLMPSSATAGSGPGTGHTGSTGSNWAEAPGAMPAAAGRKMAARPVSGHSPFTPMSGHNHVMVGQEPSSGAYEDPGPEVVRLWQGAVLGGATGGPTVRDASAMLSTVSNAAAVAAARMSLGGPSLPPVSQAPALQTVTEEHSNSPQISTQGTNVQTDSGPNAYMASNLSNMAPIAPATPEPTTPTAHAASAYPAGATHTVGYPSFNPVALECFHAHFVPLAQDVQMALTPWPPHAPRRSSFAFSLAPMSSILIETAAVGTYAPAKPQQDLAATQEEVVAMLLSFLAEQGMLACFQLITSALHRSDHLALQMLGQPASPKQATELLAEAWYQPHASPVQALLTGAAAATASHALGTDGPAGGMPGHGATRVPAWGPEDLLVLHQEPSMRTTVFDPLNATLRLLSPASSISLEQQEFERRSLSSSGDMARILSHGAQTGVSATPVGHILSTAHDQPGANAAPAGLLCTLVHSVMRRVGCGVAALARSAGRLVQGARPFADQPTEQAYQVHVVRSLAGYHAVGLVLQLLVGVAGVVCASMQPAKAETTGAGIAVFVVLRMLYSTFNIAPYAALLLWWPTVYARHMRALLVLQTTLRALSVVVVSGGVPGAPAAWYSAKRLTLHICLEVLVTPTLMHVDVTTRMVVAAVHLLPHALLIASLLSRNQLLQAMQIDLLATSSGDLGLGAHLCLLLSLAASVALSATGIGLSVIREAQLRRSFVPIPGQEKNTPQRVHAAATCVTTTTTTPATRSEAALHSAPAKVDTQGLSTSAVPQHRGVGAWPAFESGSSGTGAGIGGGTVGASEGISGGSSGSSGVEALLRLGSVPASPMRQRVRRSGMLVLPGQQHQVPSEFGL